MKLRRFNEAVAGGLLAVVLYAMISLFAYSWRNPELTQMQVLHDWREALTWSDRG